MFIPRCAFNSLRPPRILPSSARLSITIRNTELFILNLRTRMPFRFGIACLTACPHLVLRAEVEINGAQHTGLAADLLPQKWFTKTPDTTYSSDVAEMLDVIQSACTIAQHISPAPTVFDFWQQVYAQQSAWGAKKLPPLLTVFGVTLVERAIIDAFCRASQTTFARAIHENALGIRLGDVYSELQGRAPSEFLPAQPLRSVILRHTIGLSDPLTDEEILATERLDDGLPQSLEANIRVYGLTHFKIKLGGDVAHDLERLRNIAAVLDGRECAFTLDGNEQYKAVEPFQKLWAALTADASLRSFLQRLIFVEQPLHRDVALSDATARVLRAWDDRPPIIIDESDGELTALATALDSGYVGTSHKNCKGVIKSIANACLIAHRRRRDTRGQYILSAEDLTTFGPVALPQDLAVIATLGIEHAERNGHHYFHGLDALPRPMQDQMLAAHSDLYRRHERGFVTLNAQNGCINAGSVVAAPFGYDCEIDLSQFTMADQWRFESLNCS